MCFNRRVLPPGQLINGFVFIRGRSLRHTLAVKPIFVGSEIDGVAATLVGSTGLQETDQVRVNGGLALWSCLPLPRLATIVG